MIRILSKLTDRHRRILALSITSGWQSLGGIAQWSATQDPSCPWCNQHDTHTHQLLDCPAFEPLRANHQEALTFMRANRRTCWFPLPQHHPEVSLARQAMYLRHTTLSIAPLGRLPGDVTIYTDGSCDDTRDPYTARAAWSVVCSVPHHVQNEYRVFRVLACGHCPGPQTINRSELYAMVVAVEQVIASPQHSQVLYVTDSQFVYDVIDIDTGRIRRSPHKKAHWDLIHRLITLWDPTLFSIRKIKSHQVTPPPVKRNGTSMVTHVQMRPRP